MTPIRMIVLVASDRSRRQARERIRIRDKKAKSIAMAMVPAMGNPGRVIPSAMESAAPSAAPEDTPMVEPSASGFLSSPCMAAPHRERFAPVSAVQRTRGRRTERMMAAAGSPASDRPHRAAQTIDAVCCRGMRTLPAQTQNSRVSSVTAKKMEMS